MMTVLFVLVVLAALASALGALSSRQQLGAASDLAAAQALQAARAGLEWAAYQLLQVPAPPAAAPACFTTTTLVPGGSLAGFTVTVSCSRTPTSGTVSDGETALAFYEVTATACNQPSGGQCPNPATAPTATYAERQLRWTLSR